MRICIISDTHCRRTGIVIPECDVLIHCGDMTMKGDVFEINAVNEWLGKQPGKKKIVIAGNHDWLFEKNSYLAKSLITNARYLEDSEVVIDGVKFYGSPWQPRFFDWAFNLDRGQPLRDKWRWIPSDIDVLITHGPPFGILDYSQYGNMRAGCEDLLERVQQVKPKVHCFGHLHAGYGVRDINGTTFINAAILDDRYNVAHKPIIIDIDPVTKIVSHEYGLVGAE